MKKLLSISLFIATLAFAAHAAKEKVSRGTKKVIRYRQSTDIDLSGTIIKGKARAPEIFYIFQRKRTQGSNLQKTPTTLRHHINDTHQRTKGVLNL